MDTRPPLYRRLERLSESIAQDATVVSAAATGRIAGVRQALFLEEVLSSTRLAGFSLDPAAGAALLSRGVAVGGERLAVYEAVADYAEASRLIEGADARPLRPHIYLRTEEILELHRRAIHRTARAAGAWREHNLSAVPSGLVPPPHWLVPREIAAFVDRYAGGPPAEVLPLLWVARAHMRILRIQPFE
ncbi:MAG: Fic family protein, partial [Candidatus Eremiobacteraeota bacterium]|nr:Fic family protein [Candidatus Eremiobacteraeota bacterium]